LNEARGSGLTAEVALYEAARLRRDNLTDLPGALSLLREHRRRFPTGTLAYEVRLSMAEVLPKVGRYREALTDIDWLLGAQAGAERRGELLLLRGHVLRQGFENWADAERAYAQAAEVRGADGRAADPAAFWRAVCLESLGRKDEARRAYAAYLARAQASLREQAVLRLRALQREHSMPGGAQKQMQPEGGL
jgi:tetratricopeptide (TPR) repeat protein